MSDQLKRIVVEYDYGKSQVISSFPSDILGTLEYFSADHVKALETENERLREALSNIAVVGFSEDLAVSAMIAKQTVAQARAALKENPDDHTD